MAADNWPVIKARKRIHVDILDLVLILPAMGYRPLLLHGQAANPFRIAEWLPLIHDPQPMYD